MSAEFQIGSRVYLRVAVSGEPGIVMGKDKSGHVLVDWIDLPELARLTAHNPDHLVQDEEFHSFQRVLDFVELAA